MALKYLKETTKLFSHQKNAIKHLNAKRKSIIAMDVGLGKTLTALTMYAMIKNSNIKAKCLFVAIKSTIMQIPIDIDKFFNGISYDYCYNNTPKQRDKKYEAWKNGKHDVMIISYDILRNDYKKLVDILTDDTFIVFDEATAFKNHESKLFKNVSYLSSLVDRVVAMSGTVVNNKLLDKVVIANAIGINVITIRQFKSKYCKWETKNFGRTEVRVISEYKNITSFNEKIDPFVYSIKKSDVVDLPPFTINIYITDPDKGYAKVASGLCKKYFDEETKTSNVPLAYQQILNTAPKLLDDTMPELSNKFKEAIRIIEEEVEEHEKVIIFSPFKKVINEFETVLKLNLPKKFICKITGETKDRQNEILKFTEDDNYKIILGTTAIAKGINLQRANRIIILDQIIDAGMMIQLFGRISRIGQKSKNLFINYLFTRNTIDQIIYEVIQNQFALKRKTDPDNMPESLIDEMSILDVFTHMESTDAWVRKKIANIFCKA